MFTRRVPVATNDLLKGRLGAACRFSALKNTASKTGSDHVAPLNEQHYAQERVLLTRCLLVLVAVVHDRQQANRHLHQLLRPVGNLPVEGQAVAGFHAVQLIAMPVDQFTFK